jgi:hypothetical protein
VGSYLGAGRRSGHLLAQMRPGSAEEPDSFTIDICTVDGGQLD